MNITEINISEKYKIEGICTAEEDADNRISVLP